MHPSVTELPRKFQSAGYGAVYGKTSARSSNPYQTLAVQQQRVKPSDYKIPDRRGVAAGSDKRDAKKGRPFIATTTSSEAFVNVKVSTMYRHEKKDGMGSIRKFSADSDDSVF